MTDNYSEEAFGFCSKIDDSDKTELNAMTMMLVASLGRTFDFIKRECFYVKKPNEEFKNKNIDFINSLFKDIADHESEKKCVKDFLSDEFDLNMFHATLGLMTEVGEIFECLLNYNIATSVAKKNGTTISDEEKKQIRLNLIEELGDLEWYLNLARHSLGISQKEVQDINIAKLSKRYQKHMSFGADRNLEDEKNAMIKEMEK